MSHLKVKTTYSTVGAYGAVKVKELFCHHNLSLDTIIFYDINGNPVLMIFEDFTDGDNLWDAMNRLWFPFEDKWGGKLKDKVEYYYTNPWD